MQAVNPVLIQQECTVTDISARKHRDERPVVSNLTSRGIPKAKKADPIRSLEHINMMAEYFHNSNLRNYALFILGISIGLRASDLLNIKVCDVIDSDGNFYNDVYVHEKKTRKMNDPVLTETAKVALAEYLVTDTFKSSDYLFSLPYQRDIPICESTMYKALKKAARALGLPYNVGTHTLRKTFAYWTIKLHQDNPQIIYSLQEMLNHSDLKATLHYSGQTREDNIKMYNDIGDFITGNLPEAQKSVDEDKLDKILELLQCDK